jgi:hypothetical protein
MSEDFQFTVLSDLETAAERKSCIMGWYCDGEIGADEVGLFFYIWNLYDA